VKSASAFGRLLWRPAALIGLFPFFLAVAWPAFLLGDELDAGLSLWSSPEMARVLWGESVVLMAFLGIMLSAVAKEAIQSVFSFSVPNFREKVLTGKLAAGMLFALSIAAVVMAAADSRLSAEAFACGLLFFALGCAATDPLLPALPSAAIIVVLIISAAQPQRVRQLFDAAPVAAVVASFVVFAIGALRERSISIARRSVLLPPTPGGMSLGASLRNASLLRGSDVPWSTSPRSGRLRDWVVSASHEVFGMRRWGWLVIRLASVGSISAMAYGMNRPSMAGLFGAMIISFRGLGLTGNWPYPLSRKRRARLQITLNLIDTVSYAVLATAIFWAFEQSHLPRIAMFGGDDPELRGVGLIASTAIWYPLTQWLFLTSNVPLDKRMKSPAFQLKFGIRFLMIAVLGMTSFGLLQHLSRTVSPSAAAAAGLALAVAVQLCYWRFVLRYFTRRDLT
jgi:hypothetical protein